MFYVECVEADCSQLCSVPSGQSTAECGCFDGFELDQDGRTCNGKFKQKDLIDLFLARLKNTVTSCHSNHKLK